MSSRLKKELQSKRIEQYVKTVTNDLYTLKDSGYRDWVETQKMKHPTLFKLMGGKKWTGNR